ncbi:hypothetical protein Tco_0363148 [Tanacetum coccineum]
MMKLTFTRTAGKAVHWLRVEDSAALTIQVSTTDIGEVTAAKIDKLTLAQTIIEIKAAKPKVVTSTAHQQQQLQDLRTKEKVLWLNLNVPFKEEKDQIALSELNCKRYQAKLDAALEEESKLAKENKRRKANIALIEKGKEKRRQNGMMTSAKGSQKKMLGRKRAGKQQQQESSKKQKMEEDKEYDEVEEVSEDDEGELLKHLVIKKDEDIAIDAIPLATKLPVIVDYKLHKEEKLGGLWRIERASIMSTRPEDEFERVLWGDLKVMFEPDTTSDVWRMLQGYNVTLKLIMIHRSSHCELKSPHFKLQR